MRKFLFYRVLSNTNDVQYKRSPEKSLKNIWLTCVRKTFALNSNVYAANIDWIIERKNHQNKDLTTDYYSDKNKWIK